MCHYLEYVWVMRLALELGCVCRIFNTLIEKIAPITDRGTCIDRIFDICFQMQDVALLKDYMRMIGIITSVSLIGVVAENKSIQKFLLFINKRCFQIYLLHTIFTSAIRIVLMKLSISEFYIQTLIGMVVGIVVPILIGEFCSKTVLLNIFFFQLKRLND